ncbi:MAG TPA: MarC family protein [Paraburkholderia sp.]|jgi:multiple antibiotic resistance protein
MLNELLKTVLLLVTGLFPVINPPATAIITLTMIPHVTQAQRAELAMRISINSLFILLGSLSIGAYVLSFFGISVPVLRVAGGIVIAVAGWTLLQAPTDDDAEKDAQTEAPIEHGASLRAKAFYPLTLPITVGPGAISVAIALGTGSPRDGLAPVHLAGVGVALAILCVSIYVCVRFAGHLERLLGAVGIQVAMRLLAFVLLCIGVQIAWLGIAELIASVHMK